MMLLRTTIRIKGLCDSTALIVSDQMLAREPKISAP